MMRIANLFKRKANPKTDPLDELADTLVMAAEISAIDSLTPLLDKFPVLNEALRKGFDTTANVKHLDFVLTVAAVYVAAICVPDLGRPRQQALLNRIFTNLRDWNPEFGQQAYMHCGSFFDRAFDALKNAQHDPRYLVSDSIGSWVVWEALGHAPDTEEEQMLVRAIGMVVSNEFANWWQSKQTSGR
jgi:hypothetical protein